MPRKSTDKPETAVSTQDPTGRVASTRKKSAPQATSAPIARESASLTTKSDAPRPAFDVAAALASGGAFSENERIARLAYHYWEVRGRQEGSPLDDWLRAEKEVRSQSRP